MQDQMRDGLDEFAGRMRHGHDEDTVVWSRLERATPRARREIDRIVAAAIDVADRAGLDGLSMRRLATQLGTGTTSLYRYVRSKDELLSLMVDAVVGDYPMVGGSATTWRQALTIIARAYRRTLLDHPWLVSEIASRPAIGPNTLRAADHALGVLMRMGLDATAASAILATLLRYVRGAAADELAERAARRRTGMTEEQWRQTIAPYIVGLLETGAFPSFGRVVYEGEDLTDAEQFEFGLARVLDGFARLMPDGA